MRRNGMLAGIGLLMLSMAIPCRADDAPSTQPTVDAELKILRATVQKQAQEIRELRAVIERQKAAATSRPSKDERRNDGGLSSRNDHNAGRGFSYGNVSFKPSGKTVECIGEMTNNSRATESMSSFTLSIYDRKGKLLGTAPIIVMDLANGATKSFSTSLFDISVEAIAEYKIDRESGYSKE